MLNEDRNSINPQLNFFRYRSYFTRPHLDALHELTDGPTPQKSFVALHVCLSDGVTGGATRFWTSDKKHFIDVEPKIGRVLLFQQRMLLHSVEEVTEVKVYDV